MVIKTSAGVQVAALVADLGATSPVVRDAAVARLTVIGRRAVPRLIAVARDGRLQAVVRCSALRALDAIGDPRGAEAARELIDDQDGDVAMAAVAIARSASGGTDDVAAVDRLAATALDTRRDPRVREAAIRALADLEPRTLQPILDTLATDQQDSVRDLALSLASAPRTGSLSPRVLEAAVAGALPDDPHDLDIALGSSASLVALADLRRLIDVIRARESAISGGEQDRWIASRGAVHAALARRGSRLGLFDLRDSLAGATEPLPVAFVAALVDVGDASCLEAVATAYSRAMDGAAGSRDWWHRHLADAFGAIVSREGLTRRHAIVKRIEQRWPVAFRPLWAARPVSGQ